MFSNLLFLILVLLVISLAPEAEAGMEGLSPGVALLEGLAAYGMTLALIVFFATRCSLRIQTLSPFLVNSLLLLFILVFHFALAAHRLYLPWIQESDTLFASITLLFYFGGIGLFHFLSAPERLRHKPSLEDRFNHTQLQLRFLLPMVLPFLFYQLLFDVLRLVPSDLLRHFLDEEVDSLWEGAATLLFTLLFLALLMGLLPGLIQRIWGCQPIPFGPLSQRLEGLCARAKFKHAGLMIWTIMNHTVTAAIIGIIPRFRYVLFTKGILQRFTPEEVEAVLAHEIGHSQNHHLLYYPLVVMGMMVCGAFFSLFFDESISQCFLLLEFQGYDHLWSKARPLAVFLPYAVIISLYFRLVFGYFSRLFERQADLHPLLLSIPAETIIQALDHVGIATGHTHDHPSWHHYSLRQRMEFLRAAADNPQLVTAHNRKVRRMLRSYLTLLSGGVLFCFLALVPQDFPLVGRIPEVVAKGSHFLNRSLNAPLLTRAATKVSAEHPEWGPMGEVQPIVKEAMLEMQGSPVPGLMEFYAAILFEERGAYHASYLALDEAWNRWDFKRYGALRESLVLFSRSLLKATKEEPSLQESRTALERRLAQ